MKDTYQKTNKMKDTKLKNIQNKFPIDIRDKIEGNCKEGKKIN